MSDKKDISSRFIEVLNELLKRGSLPDKKALMKIFKWGRKKATEKIRIHLNYYADLFPKLNISEQDMQNNHFFCDGKRIFEL